MDIFGILEPDPHENLCGSETLGNTINFEEKKFKIILEIKNYFKTSIFFKLQYKNKLSPKEICNQLSL